MNNIEEVKHWLKMINEFPIDYISQQICQLFEAEVDGSRIIQTNEYNCHNTLDERLREQDTQIASILEQKCQERVERIFNSDKIMYAVWMVEGTTEYGGIGEFGEFVLSTKENASHVMFKKEDWQALKKQEGIDD